LQGYRYDKLFISVCRYGVVFRMGLFLSVILPIIAVFASGFTLQRIRALYVRSIAAVSLYILIPALVFVSLYEAEFNSGYIVIIVYMFMLFYCMVGLNKLLAKIFHWQPKTVSAAIRSTGCM